MDLNRVLVAGRLTADPELKNLPSGDPVCNFTLAINRRWRDAQTSEEREDAVFLDVKCYGKRAPVMHEHFRKGRNILLEGSLRQDRWETKDGQKRSKIVLYAERFEFIGPPPVRDPAAGAGPESRVPDASSDSRITDVQTADVQTTDTMAPVGARGSAAPIPPAEPVRPSSLVARRRRERVAAGASAAGSAIDPAQLPF